MKRFLLPALLAVSPIVAGARCASSLVERVTITRVESSVASCTKVGEVEIAAQTPRALVHAELAKAASARAADTVLIAAEDARSGVTYRCSARSTVR